MQQFILECLRLFDMAYTALIESPYFGFMVGLLGILICIAVFRQFWRGSRKM